MSASATWLITGGCGFIGTNLVRHLQAQLAVGIRVLDNLTTARWNGVTGAPSHTMCGSPSAKFPGAGDPVEVVVGDVTNSSLASEAARGADVIVHLAANTGVLPSIEDPSADCRCNVIGTLNLLEAARDNNVPHFVFASSGAVLGEKPPPISEATPAEPISPYGASKLAGESYCRVYWETFRIGTVALRFGNVYGPFSAHKQSAIPTFIRNAMDNVPLTVYGSGHQTRDFVYVEDLVDAICRAATHDQGGEVFQIASGKETAIGDLAELIARSAAGLIDHSVPVRHAERRAGEIDRICSDISKADRVLGWRPGRSLQDAVPLTVRWFFENVSSRGS